MTPQLQWALLASGRSGQTEVNVGQSYGPEESFALEINKPNWSLRFCIPEPGIVRELVSFMRLEGEKTIIAGTFDGTPVEVRRDREYRDRFFIVIGRGSARTEFIIAGEQQVSELSSAFSQVVEDL